MRLNTPRIRRLTHRVLARHSIDLRSLAKREWILCEERPAAIPKALYLEGAIEKIVALSPWRSWDAEMSLIHGTQRRIGASRAHLIENVDVVGAYLYCGPATEMPGYGRETYLLKEASEHVTIDRANLVTTFSGSHFFGPLLLDDFTLELIAEDGAENLTMAVKPYAHEPEYRGLVDLAGTRRVYRARVKHLTMYTEPAQNAFKEARYRELRARIRRNLAPAPAGSSSPGIYLKRGQTGELRILKNEAEIERLLAAMGFDIIEPARLSVEEIARRTLDAQLVVSVEGSHLSHAIYTMHDQGAFLVLQPPDRFALPYKEFTDCLDMRFGFVVGDPAGEGFTVPLDDIRRMLDLLARHVR